MNEYGYANDEASGTKGKSVGRLKRPPVTSASLRNRRRLTKLEPTVEQLAGAEARHDEHSEGRRVASWTGKEARRRRKEGAVGEVGLWWGWAGWAHDFI